MAVRIPNYDQRLTPESGGIQASARGAPVSDATGRALGNLAKAGEQWSEVLLKKDQADAMTDAFKKVSEAQVHWDQYISDASKNAPDGAPNFTPQVMGEYSKYQAQTLAGITHPVARRWAEQHLVTLGGQLQQKAMTFEAQAGVANREAQTTVALQAQAQRVAADPSTYDDARTTVLGAIANVGYDAAQRPQAALKATEFLDAALWQGIVQRDPKGAEAALRAHFGLPSTAVPVPSTTAPTVASIWPLLERTESGGQQGAVSRKGAVGVAQVMPGTGPEAAKLAGLPWDENKFKTDAAYNRALGQAYLAKQLQDFGSMDKALAAYNAGPGRVREALAKGEAGWLSRMPAETRNYVAGIMAAPGANVAPPPSQALPAAPVNPQYAGWAKNLSPSQALQFLNAAESEANRQGTVLRGQLENTINNHLAGFNQGVVPDKLLTEADFTQAYGQQGVQRFAAYQQAAQGGAALKALEKATDAQAAQILEANKPGSPDDPLYAGAVQRYEALRKAADQLRTERTEDPMLFALKHDLGAKPLDFNDQKAFSEELARRVGVARSVSETYGAQPLLLAKAEATALARGFELASAPQQRQMLETMRRTVTDDGAFTALMQQIRPDSPVTAYAGLAILNSGTKHVKSWMGQGRRYDFGDVAQIMLEGESLINPTKAGKAQDGKGATFPMPEETVLRYSFNSQVGSAFAGTPTQANAAYQAVKAYYAGQSARKGDYSGSVDQGRLDEAVEAVLGGVTDLNGKGQTFRPYRMDEPTFERAMTDSFNAVVARNGFKGQNFNNYGAIAIGNDRYYLKVGNSILYNRDRTPVVIDLSNWQPPAAPAAGGGK